MNTEVASTSVSAETIVDIPAQKVFELFTERFDQIKPREHNLLGADIAESVLEPRAGGRVYDRGTDGNECQWGRVLAYEPPERIVFSWDISPQWRLEADRARTSEVEVRFIAEGDSRTRVLIAHRHLDRHGEGWEHLAQAVRGDNGWPLYLQRVHRALNIDG